MIESDLILMSLYGHIHRNTDTHKHIYTHTQTHKETSLTFKGNRFSHFPQGKLFADIRSSSAGKQIVGSNNFLNKMSMLWGMKNLIITQCDKRKRKSLQD